MKLKRKNILNHSRLYIVLPMLTVLGFVVFSVISTNYKPSWVFNWNGIRNEIQDSVQVAEKAGITSGFDGLNTLTINGVKRRKWIMKNASESELLQLIDYPDGTVKAIAYEGLIRKKGFENRTKLTLQAISDTTYLLYFDAFCKGWEMGIGEYLIQNVLMIDDRIPPPPITPDYGLTKSDKNLILSKFKEQQRNK